MMCVQSRKGRLGFHYRKYICLAISAAVLGCLMVRPGHAGQEMFEITSSAGYALEFDGDDVATAEENPALDLTENNQLTLEAWVYAQPEASQKGILGKCTYGFRVIWNQLRFILETSERGSTLSAPQGAMSVNTWTHIAATWDGSIKRLFINGVEVASQPAAGDISPSSCHFLLGCSYYGWTGLIDEVRIWNIARSPSELLSTMNRPLLGTEPGLVAYWDLDEGAGDYAYDGSGNGITINLRQPWPGWTFPTWTASDIPGFFASKGDLELRPQACPCAGDLEITVMDFDLVGTGTATVLLSTGGGDAETVELLESPPGSGVFTGQIPLQEETTSIGDNVLQVTHGEIATATYEDADDGSGAPATVTRTLPVDCIYPVISEVYIEPFSWQALVEIRTDELTAGTVHYGTACDQLTSTASVLNAIDSHQIFLTGLTPETAYYFVVEVEDQAGNVTIADNDGACFSFTTPGFPSPPFFDDFESGFLNSSWLVTGTEGFRTEVTESFGPQSGSRHLILGCEPGYAGCRTEVTLFLDLTDHQDVTLVFWAKSLGNKPNPPPPGPFTGGANFDGVAISADGVTWYVAVGLQYTGNEYQRIVVDLDAAIARHDLSYSESFRIRFNQYDGIYDGVEERIALDNIRVYGSLPDDLALAPDWLATFSGDQGGPFTPPCQSFLLTNTGVAPLSWSASASAEWLDVLPGIGILDPAATEEVQVCIGSAAEQLQVGDYWDDLFFTNLESGNSRWSDIELLVNIFGNFTLGFDGNDQAFSSDYSFVDLGNSNQFTVEALVQRRRFGRYWHTIIGSSGCPYPYQLSVYGDGVVHFRICTSDGNKELVTPSGAVANMTWVHLAASWDGATIRLYVNGEERASAQHGGNLTRPSHRIYLGDGDWGKGWEGFIDEVRIWNVVRSATEIAASVSRPVSPDEDGLVGYWKIDEGRGQSTHDLSETRTHLQLGLLPYQDPSDPAWVPFMRPFIEPSQPTTIDDLRCSVELEVEAANETDFSYRWFRDGEEITEPLIVNGEVFFATAPVLSNLFTSKHESYLCIVQDQGDTPIGDIYTSPVSILNSTPTAPVVEIIPENPIPSDDLTAFVSHSSLDLDGDDTAYAIRWYRSQDGGQTFERMLELMSFRVPQGFLAEGDLWRAEVVPVDLGDAGSEGEAGWDQVYVGVNNRPVVTLTRPGSQNAMALSTVIIAWEAEDIDGDAVTVDLYYDTDDIEGGGFPIAMDQPQTGSMSWQPPGAEESFASADLSGDGLVDADDLFILASRWCDVPEKARYWIFARVWDEKGAIGEAFSPGEIIVPEGFPTNMEGLLRALGEWSQQ